MKYIVETTCYGFKGQYWEKGTVIELSDKETPPPHFKPMAEEVSAELPAKAEVAQKEKPKQKK
jgi:hypothetical protein